MSEQTETAVTAGWADRSKLIYLHPAPEGPSRVNISDRLEIDELFSRYAVAYDERRLDVLASCFAATAEYQAQLGPEVMAHFSGPEAIIDGIRSVMAQQGHEQRRHLIANIILDQTTPDTVTAIAYTFVSVTDTSGPSLGAVAIYDAELIRTDVGWRFTRIIVGMDGYRGQAPRRGDPAEVSLS